MNDIRPPRPETIAGRLPKRIVIVGSNESAWMAAACLSRHVTNLGCRISILPCSEPRAEFPGETSLPSLRGLLGNLRIDEHEMMRETQATYQLATQFSDWVQPERDFWKPFAPSERARNVSLFDAWFAERNAGRLLRPFHSYSLHWGASLAGKSPYGFSGPSAISQSGSYAFHLDGRAFSTWLRKIALASGVEEILGEIQSVAFNGHGGVAQIRLTHGPAIASDFFIDCTGVEARLQGSAGANSFESWHDKLLCDRMITLRLPGRRQIPPYTRITGLASGWLWQTPLAASIDAGYIFASSYATDDMADQQMREALTLDGMTLSEDVTPEYSSFHVGMQSHFWRDNVLTLGSTSCMVDPLVSAGRHLCQVAIETFIELFPERSANNAVVSYYNERMQTAVKEIRDFTQMHYLLSKRTDTPFWQTVTTRPMSEQLSQRLALYSASGSVGPLAPEAIGEASYRYILTGCGRLPNQPTAYATSVDPAMIQQSLRSLLKSNEATLKDLPLHEELLDWIHTQHNGLQRSA
jgi:tryptophan halogenase